MATTAFSDMCIAIPMQVLRMDGQLALCAGRNGEVHLDTVLTGPLEAGQWVLGFLGAAREIVSPAQAQRISGALDALEAVLAGDAAGLDSHFADLVGREPQLPDFLKGAIPDD